MPRSPLEAWLHDNWLTGADLARRLGVSTATVSSMLSGTYTPSLGLALLIERETKGAVRPRDLMPSDQVGPMRRNRKAA